jgi:hypothetical protein
VGNALQSVLNSIFSFCEVILYCAGWVNDMATSVLSDFGIPTPYQIYIFLAIMVAVSVLALRWLGGFMGWVLVLVLVVLLLQRVLPDFTSYGTPNLPVAHPLQTAL